MRKRLIFGLIFAVLGALIGYGFVSSSPAPHDLWLTLKWSGGLAIVCGALAAANPDGALRPRGGWRRH